ncbi:hydrogenase maturation protease [Geomesophilobacter sediminis]|uniref:Hydrogenase maturation protease n=1 Tax=Geomesophilobacter sediminis TaxID=2798584 RepID=A0A8J7M0C5_9BACT|nr:hydrogenase maturation protease [Geomesophilobacter sediminis]MBJ6724467.1 hydrogenase maturation protease [Geomesophilobacter sediminis]
MKTVVVGLGNPILTDDGVGPAVARLLRSLPAAAEIHVTEAYAGGLRLMEAMAGFDRAVIVDAMQTGGRPGTVRRINPEELSGTRNLLCTHDADLPTALALARSLGLAVPDLVEVVGIEAEEVEAFGEELTEKVRAALPLAVQTVLELVIPFSQAGTQGCDGPGMPAEASAKVGEGSKR